MAMTGKVVVHNYLGNLSVPDKYMCIASGQFGLEMMYSHFLGYFTKDHLGSQPTHFACGFWTWVRLVCLYLCYVVMQENWTCVLGQCNNVQISPLPFYKKTSPNVECRSSRWSCLGNSPFALFAWAAPQKEVNKWQYNNNCVAFGHGQTFVRLLIALSGLQCGTAFSI